MNLSQLVGNEAIKEQLAPLRDARELSHAYILSGAPGSGRHTLARLLCAAYACKDPRSGFPCLRCNPCRKALRGIHPDVEIVQGKGDSPIKIDQVRELRKDVYVRPNEAPRRVFLLEHAQRMQGPAQNALLKILEDGPEYAVFLLLEDEGDSLLPTIRSRCECLSLHPVRQEQAERCLLARFPKEDPTRVREEAAACQGILGRAVETLLLPPEEREARRGLARKMAECIARGDELGLLLASKDLENLKGVSLRAALDQCVEELGLALRRGAEPKLILRARELLHRARLACDGNVSGGQLSGLLCAGLFLS